MITHLESAYSNSCITKLIIMTKKSKKNLLPSAKNNSLLGYIIWPCKGRNTDGIFSNVSKAVLLLTNGIIEHSAK